MRPEHTNARMKNPGRQFPEGSILRNTSSSTRTFGSNE